MTALEMEKQPLLERKGAEQHIQSSSADAATEVQTSTHEADEIVRKFVMNQRRGAVECNATNPTRQLFVQFGGSTRAVEVVVKALKNSWKG